MITPGFAPTATERILPRLALDFTTEVLDARVTVTRALNTGTRTNSSGVIEIVNANLPRFDYSLGTPRGLLIEEQRTNILLNSLIDGTNLTTQTVSVTAAAWTLSFYGTGQIVLSGAASATVTGTGNYPSRKTHTFTPSAGSLTLTVTGDVKFAQLELGSFASSFIPTSGTSATRNNDAISMTGTNFSSWFNASEGTFVVGYFGTVGSYALSANDGTGNNYYGVVLQAATTVRSVLVAAGAFQFVQNAVSSVGTPNKTALAYKTNSVAASSNASNAATSNSIVLPTVDRLAIGSFGSFAFLNGCVSFLRYYPQRVINAETRAFSSL